MSEYLPKYDIWITQQRMPLRVKAFCCCKGDDNIAVINEDLSDKAKIEAVKHEAKHISRNDLQSEKSIIELEDLE